MRTFSSSEKESDYHVEPAFKPTKEEIENQIIGKLDYNKKIENAKLPRDTKPIKYVYYNATTGKITDKPIWPAWVRPKDTGTVPFCSNF